MASRGRSSEEIRREIASERDQLSDAVGDLREGLRARGRIRAIAGGVVGVGAALLTARAVRRRRR